MASPSYQPPFEITARALAASGEIMRLVGRYEGLLSPKPQPKLRRANQIRTVMGSLAIEGNSLAEEQITAILDKKRVIGPKREIREVENAIAAYARAPVWHPDRSKDLLDAHRVLMKGLVDDAGRFRSRGVGVFQGARVAHVAPPAHRVPGLVAQLLSFVKRADMQPLIASAVAHYELEFIHPFSDGNGRIGRLWQHLVLVRYQPLFGYLPIESVIQAKQKEYYRVLEACDKAGSSSHFIEFSLLTVQESLEQFLKEIRPEPATGKTRLEIARQAFGGEDFSRKDYLARFATLSTATASRDLRDGVDARVLKRLGAKALTRYRFR
jgi:Fic family protein